MPIDDAVINELRRDVTRNVFSDAALFGLNAAVPTLLYGQPALWIPRAVSDEHGGRETLYDLSQGEETLLGIYVLGQQIVKDVVTRTGDTSYSDRLETVGGKVLFAGEGDLEVLDDRV